MDWRLSAVRARAVDESARIGAIDQSACACGGSSNPPGCAGTICAAGARARTATGTSPTGSQVDGGAATVQP